MTTVYYEISNTVNYEPPGFDVHSPADEFPAIYGNEDFSFTLTFTADDPTLGVVAVVNVASISAPDYVELVPDGPNVIHVIKDPTVSIFDESYLFSVFDLDIENTNPIQEASKSPGEAITFAEEKGSFLIEWNPPPEEFGNSHAIEVGNFVFDVELAVGPNVEKTYTQDYYWSSDRGQEIFDQVLQRQED